MDKKQIINVLDVYYKLCSLKRKKRQGWVYWNVAKTRIESIAEHVFGVQQLAWVIYSEAQLDLDIFKVIAMLSLHETEEVIIGDITPFDNITDAEKLAMGDKAVKQIFGKINKSEILIELINEFNQRNTKEAQFAYLCDKMECDLQVKRYSDLGKCSVENANKKIISDDRVKTILENGAKTVADVFLENDKGKYKGTVFEDVVNFLKKHSKVYKK